MAKKIKTSNATSSEKDTSPCFVCKKVWKKTETDNFVSHESVGTVCKHHYGVEAWYKKLTKKENV